MAPICTKKKKNVRRKKNTKHIIKKKKKQIITSSKKQNKTIYIYNIYKKKQILYLTYNQIKKRKSKKKLV